MKLRMATLEDLPAICALGRSMHSQSTFAPMNYDIDRVKETIGGLIDKSQFVVVAEATNGEVIGGMAGMVTQSWFGSDSVANDLAIFIHPSHRGGVLAVRLMKAFIEWARLAGAKQIRPGVTTGHARAEELFERLGFVRCGASFVMEGV
ncbi:MAG: N-acetyltransferase family protein [Burkholderiales bacterium]